VAVYHRIGDVFKLLQILENPSGDPTGSYGQRTRLSSDGLTLVVEEHINDHIYIYKRTNIAQPFSDYQEIQNQDVGGPSVNYAIGLSPSGKILAIGNYQSDLNATDAGAVYLWQTLRDQ
jgi:hypothetical protein